MLKCVYGVWFAILLQFYVIHYVITWPALHNFDIWGDNENVVKNIFGEKFVKNISPKKFLLRKAKVLNFFPVPVEEECRANDGRRSGICMNTYECRILSGKSYGPCALGFGVCCVFTAQCGMDVFNNITYLISPNFPNLYRGMTTCSHKIKKIDSEISQFRFDFIHFTLGQPNRQNGICETDIFTISGANGREIQMCGLNSGQHLYIDVENIKDPVNVIMNLTRQNVDRLWEIKITQIPFSQRAPAGCLQYHSGRTGIIQTMNFADNGRHLADQDYTICTRQEEGMCSITYEPCDENSFRIGPGRNETQDDSPVADDVGSGGGPLADESVGRFMCDDRIVLPCDSEEFIMPGYYTAPGTCALAHCGESLCPEGESPCRIESTITPFTVGIQFGPGARMESPEDNLGVCLKYEQQPCAV